MGIMDATIHFDGEKFQAAKWDRLLRDMGFRVSGGAHEKAVYVSGGNNLVAESRGFTKRGAEKGYEWYLALKQTRRWEGSIKFYAVLLAAFAVPQDVNISLGDFVFTDAKTLKAYAESMIVGNFGLDELTDRGIYRRSEGIQFL